MSLPHTCECQICGATFPLGSPLGVPAGGNITGLEKLFPESPYASSRADELAPRDPPSSDPAVVWNEAPSVMVPVCVHGYTRCMPCKFPTP